MDMLRRIPLTVIGGFLGAGKTTLLNRLLCATQGRRFAVLVNDFGALNIDAALVATQDGQTIALTNGCVCCQIGDDLTAALVAVLDTRPMFDAIIIEASGVSDPWRIAQVGLADPGLGLEAVVVLVDASAVLDHAADPLLADTVVRQLKAADLIVLNKIDLMTADALEGVRDWISGAAGATPTFETVQANLPAPLLTGALQPHGDGHGHRPDSGHDHGALFDTWVHRPEKALQARQLRALLRAMPEGVLRLKGLLRTDEHGAAEIQFAGKHGSLRAAVGAAPLTGVVAIGLKGRLPVPQLEAAFAEAALG